MPMTTLGKLGRATAAAMRPTQTLRFTNEGWGYFVVWLLLLITGLYRQINLVLLIAGLAAGPMVASIFVSHAMLRGLRIHRRFSGFVFSGDPMVVEYVLENPRRWREALAIVANDRLVPDEPGAPSARALDLRAFFPRVPGRDRSRQSWRGIAPARGRYRFEAIDLITRSPFGLQERRVTIEAPDTMIVYPTVGTLTRRWRLVFREATETRRGRRHDRSAQQQEYHGLRDYRAGDSPRWIHWRTTARLGQPMVKEFEQQSEQDLVLLLDPWLPRTKATADQREAVESAIRFCATVCLETCRGQGRRLLLGWTGATPGLRHGPASIRLLHELLESLALLRATPEGQVGGLIDVIPPGLLRDSLLLIVSTRPVNLAEELERSARLSEGIGLRLSNRVILLDASRGDLDHYVRYDHGAPAPGVSPRDRTRSMSVETNGEADRDRTARGAFSWASPNGPPHPATSASTDGQEAHP